MMRQGKVVAAGPIEITLTADNLVATFGLPLEVERRGRTGTPPARAERVATAPHRAHATW